MPWKSIHTYGPAFLGKIRNALFVVLQTLHVGHRSRSGIVRVHGSCVFKGVTPTHMASIAASEQIHSKKTKTWGNTLQESQPCSYRCHRTIEHAIWGNVTYKQAQQWHPEATGGSSTESEPADQTGDVGGMSLILGVSNTNETAQAPAAIYVEWWN